MAAGFAGRGGRRVDIGIGWVGPAGVSPLPVGPPPMGDRLVVALDVHGTSMTGGAFDTELPVALRHGDLVADRGIGVIVQAGGMSRGGGPAG